MAQKADNNPSLGKTWDRIVQTNIQLKRNVESYQSDYLTDQTYEHVREMYIYLKNARAALVALRAAPGLNAYVKDEVNDPAYNASTELNATRDAIDAVTAWLEANVNPAKAIRPVTQWDNQPSIIKDLASPADMAGILPLLVALLATLD